MKKAKKIAAVPESLKISQKLEKIAELEKLDDAPWEIRRALPDFSLSGTNVCLTQDGDYLTKDEARFVALWLWEQLS